MKNIGMVILAAMMIASCGKKEEEKPTEVINTTETVEKTVIVDTVKVEAPEDKDGTTVKVGSDGVEIKSKNGDKSTSVEVKK